MAESNRYLKTMPIESPTPAFGAPRKAVLWNRLSCLVGAALIAASLCASSAAASPATYKGISAGGKVAVFTSDEALVSGDTDSERDVYERAYDATLDRYVTREVSVGPIGGNDALPAQYAVISTDGNEVFFTTREPLVEADSDDRTDIYVRDLDESTTTLVSAGGNGNFNAGFAQGGLTDNGEELFFVTDEKLSGADDDGSPDIYVRDLVEGTTLLVSQGAADCVPQGCGNEDFGVSFNAISLDGNVVVFSSNEALSDEDTDNLQDVYVRDVDAEATTLVSTPGACPGSVDCKAVYGGVSNDGSHVFFESGEQIAEADEDEQQDVYDWSSGLGATLASIGSDGGNEDLNATYAGSSADGSHVFFQTSESLDAGTDSDEARDVYDHAGAGTTLVSTGPTGGNGPFHASLRWVSPDGSSSAVVFSTDESLLATDSDGKEDVYVRSVGTTSLVSTGPLGGNGAFDAAFAGASHDGTHLFFITAEPLVGEDKDASSDIYEVAAGVTTLISIGPVGGSGAFASGLAGVSEDADHALFTTEERLTEGDPDAEFDIYDHSASGTLLVSVGNLATVGPVVPVLTATNPASPGASLTPSIIGEAAANAWVKLYKSSNCSGNPVAQGTAGELSTGLSVSVAAGSTTSFRATAELAGLVSPCSASIIYKQETPPPPPPPPPSEEKAPGGGTAPKSGSTSAGKTTGANGAKGNGGITFVTPETLITFGPAAKTRKHRVVFRFSDATGQPSTSFSCKLDRHRWNACNSPKRLTKLAAGRHVFAVKAINAAGAWDDKPAKRSFKVVR